MEELHATFKIKLLDKVIIYAAELEGTNLSKDCDFIGTVLVRSFILIRDYNNSDVVHDVMQKVG